MRKNSKIKIDLLKLFMIFSGLLICDYGVTQISNPKSISFNQYPLQSESNQKAFPNNSQATNVPLSNASSLGMNANDMMKQHQQLNQQRMGYVPPVLPPTDPMQIHQMVVQQYNKQINSANNDLYKILEEEKLNSQQQQYEQQKIERYKKTLTYKAVFDELIKMDNGTVAFSLKKAVFMIENVYCDYTLKYADYDKEIKSRVNEIRLIMKNEKISENNNLGKNYAIQKLFSEKITEYKDNKLYKTYIPFGYDFEDYTGLEDWSKMFVSKLLSTGKGQCHSLPLLYLILAEEINASAWLSLAPEHSFIQFSDNRKSLFYNFETTNGNSVSTDWIMESGYINTQAIKNRIYLDTLGKRELMSTLIADLVMGYTTKIGYDQLVFTMVDHLVQINPNSIQGQIFKADLLTLKTKQALQKVGKPPIEKIKEGSEANVYYNDLMKQYEVIKNLGYMQMPSEMYNQWLISLNNEKNIQEKQKLKTSIISNVKKSN